jgi:hypothetical protein
MSTKPMSGLPEHPVCARCGLTFEMHVDQSHEFKTIDLQVIEMAKAELRAAVRGDDKWRHPDLYEDAEYVTEAHPVDDIDLQEAAQDFMYKMGMTPTPDATGQLLEVFVPCLRIMCDQKGHPWPSDGAMWRKGGILPVMIFMKAKFERYWYRTWNCGIRHDDSGFDFINFAGFTLRADSDSRFGNLGEPSGAPDA